MTSGPFLTLRTTLLILIAGCLAAITGCDGWQESAPAPTGGVLRVVSLREPLSRIRPGQGYEHDLLLNFAKSHGATLEWQWVKTPEEAFAQLQAGRADLSAGRWSAESFRGNGKVMMTPAYEEVPAVLVCSSDRHSRTEKSFLESWFHPQAAADEDAWIESTSLHIAVHRRDWRAHLQDELMQINPNWIVEPTNDSPLTLAAEVTQRKIDCFVTDQSTGEWLHDQRPWLQITRELNVRLSKAFLVSPTRTDLMPAYDSWFQKQSRHGTLLRMRSRYLGFQQALGDRDRIRLFKMRLYELPLLKPKFKKYANEFEIPWQLLAAVAYQESQWDGAARSLTGVRGIMMLTTDTAKQMGVSDRENVDESLWGGAKYLRSLIDMQPENLHPRDRLALALAAYNVGWGHLLDAQQLAREAGHRSSSFWDLRKYFLQLSNPEIASGLRFGLARGDEPIMFTERVLAFYDLLSDSSDVQ